METIKRIACIGSSAIDRRYRFTKAPIPGSASTATSSLHHGGVIRNVAETLAWLGLERNQVELISAVGDDAAGRSIVATLGELGVQTHRIVTLPGPTSECASMIVERLRDEIPELVSILPGVQPEAADLWNAPVARFELGAQLELLQQPA